jgi:ATP-dependent RNA helicase SUPV3L1/SUV3
LQKRLAAWLGDFIALGLAPLLVARQATLSGPARGLVFQLSEALGSMPRHAAAAQVASLSAIDRKTLARLGIRLGVESIFMPALIKPAAQRLRTVLWTTHAGVAPLAPPPQGRISIAARSDVPPDFYEAVGFRLFGQRAVRVDMLERFAAECRKLARHGPFAASPALLALLGAPPEDAAAVLEALGFKAQAGDPGPVYVPAGRRPPKTGAGRRRSAAEASPFAALRRMTSA